MRWVEWLAQVQKLVMSWRGQQALSGGDVGQLCWTSWIDPGKATGFGAAVYLVPPASIIAPNGNMSLVGQAADGWMKTLKGLGCLNVPADLLGTYDATGALVLTYWAEDFYARDDQEEPAMVRRLMARVRGLGAIWYGSESWDVEELYAYEQEEPVAKRLDVESCGLGAAGIGSESFRVLRMDSSADYVSPLRVIAMYRYALEDEFGVRLLTNSPGDAKNAFGAVQLKRLGVWVPGLDHVRDGLAHTLFGIRKQVGRF